jgi:hypothetical protein
MNKTQSVGIGLTFVNLLILFAQMVAGAQPAVASQEVVPVLRGRSLEIVDDQGRIRAQIMVRRPEMVNGVLYPEAVLLRLADPKSGPVVKLTAAANGSALGLSDDANGGVQLYARDTASFVRVVDKRTGRERVLKP